MKKFLIAIFSAPFLQTFPPHCQVDCSCKQPMYGPPWEKKRYERFSRDWKFENRTYLRATPDPISLLAFQISCVKCPAVGTKSGLLKLKALISRYHISTGRSPVTSMPPDKKIFSPYFGLGRCSMMFLSRRCCRLLAESRLLLLYQLLTLAHSWANLFSSGLIVSSGQPCIFRYLFVVMCRSFRNLSLLAFVSCPNGPGVRICVAGIDAGRLGIVESV